MAWDRFPECSVEHYTSMGMLGPGMTNWGQLPISGSMGTPGATTGPMGMGGSRRRITTKAGDRSTGGSHTSMPVNRMVPEDPGEDAETERMRRATERRKAAQKEGARWGRTGDASRGPNISSRGRQTGISSFAVPVGIPGYMTSGTYRTNIVETAEGRGIIREKARAEVARIANYFAKIRDEDRRRRVANKTAVELGMAPRRRLSQRNPYQHLALPAAGYTIKF